MPRRPVMFRGESHVLIFDGRSIAFQVGAVPATIGVICKPGGGLAIDDDGLYATGGGGGGSLPDGDYGDVTVSGSGTVITIDADVVTFSKMQNVSTARILGRATSGTGDIEQLTGTQATTLLDAFTSSLKGLAPASGGGTTNYLRADGTWASPPGAGLADGDKGDITVSSSGTVWTIDAGAVTYAKIQDVSAASRILGRGSAGGSGDVEEISLGTGLSMSGTTLSVSGVFLTDGDKGDITVASSGAAWSVDANVVTNAKLADMATARFKGRVTAGTGDPEDLTGTQATSLLDVFTSSLNGLAPASGGGTTNFLRADGTWAAPAGGGGGSPTDGEINEWFGDGSDGDLSLTSSTATGGPLSAGVLTRDAYYNDLTISSSGSIQTNGFRIFVRGTLDITAAQVRAIWPGVTNGGNASNPTAGAAGATISNPWFTGSSGGAGGAGGALSTNGTAGTAASSSSVDHGNAGGAGGAGATATGGFTGGSGGSSSNSSTAGFPWFRNIPRHALLRGTTMIGGGVGGGGGGGGGGSSSFTGGGGGGGGEGGRVLCIFARTINRGGSTAADAIQAPGGTGGAGGTAVGPPFAGNGGGGAGGSGGLVFIVHGGLTGSTATNAVSASGGAGGTGATGGAGGGGGRIYICDLFAASSPVSTSSGSSGSAASGSSGGAGNTFRVNL